ncbi:hypothetical protein [Roseateles chitosanitabidus]|uniref:hypothetical protein n=1 Tax=Roseateles chitosanitabidus TaxID=65048 RepID=UPI000834FC54|nr:hypothetical protein [Roseateles chitosanitabidus]
MGYAQAGLVLKRSALTDEPIALAERLTGERAEELDRKNPWPFDPRLHHDLLVQFSGDVCVITNNDLVWPLLERADADASALHRQLGAPDLFIAFCRYDSGGTFGYAIVKQGQVVRRRLQTTDVPSLPPLSESGAPLPLEAPWLSANFFYDEEDEEIPEDEREKILYLDDKDDGIPEYWLTIRLLEMLLEEHFGVIPWDLGSDPQDRFLRMQDRQG